MKKVLITGGSGFLGKNLSKKLLNDYQLFCTSRNQKQLQQLKQNIDLEILPGDVTNYHSINEVISRVKPDIIVHAAATKFVGLSEKFPNECIDVNILGSQNVLRSSINNDVEYVLGISTDKATSPIENFYGHSKAIMENLFTLSNGEYNTKFGCVRYGNVAWSTGSVFPIWEEMTNSEKHVVSTGPEMSRFFFSIDDAVRLIEDSINFQEQLYGKILSIPMKGVKVSRILDIWCKHFKCDWSVGEIRSGDRPLEYLISEQEKLKTKNITLGENDYFLLDPKSAEEYKDLETSYSSLSASQFNDEEILDLILNKPDKDFL